MALMTVSEILQPSVYNGWAVGAYDVADLSMTMGVVDAAVADDAPVIIMVYPGMVPVEHYPTYAAFISKEIERSCAKAALALDHGSNLTQIRAALDAGFTGVMIDASSQPLERNIQITKEVVEFAHRYSVPVEAELGRVGMGSDILQDDEMRSYYTRVEDARRFVEETGVDALAVAIGTAHGIYKFEPNLDFERLQELRRVLDLPLVLHGSSGTPTDQLSRAVELGINKINVYTDIRMRVLDAIRKKVMAELIESYDLSDLMNITREQTKQAVQEKNALFGSVRRGNYYIR